MPESTVEAFVPTAAQLDRKENAAAPRTYDYFAELYVAGLFGDHGWAVYFPKRDVGFDFVVSKEVRGEIILRPVQVKGLYPTAEKLDKNIYGFRGKLTAVHRDMVLAIPFFAATGRGPSPSCIAYMPLPHVRQGMKFSCQPGRLIAGVPSPRPSYAGYFDYAGLTRLENLDWPDDLPTSQPGQPPSGDIVPA